MMSELKELPCQAATGMMASRVLVAPIFVRGVFEGMIDFLRKDSIGFKGSMKYQCSFLWCNNRAKHHGTELSSAALEAETGG